MAGESIEQLFVEIGSDASKLLTDVKKATNESVKELEKVEQAGKKAFDGIADSAEKLGEGITRDVNGRLRDAQGRFVKLGEDGKKAFDDNTKAAGGFGDFIKNNLTGIVTGFLGLFAAEKILSFFNSIRQGAVESNAEFEVYTSQFETLLGSTGAAKERLEELAKFGVETPFELPEIVEASRVLQVFGGTTLATGDNLRMIGDIAAGVNQPFKDVAFWVGRMYDSIQNGQPFGEASARLQEMGALSGDTRRKLEEMQKAGADGSEIFAVFSEEVGGKFTGGMEKLSSTLQGVRSNLADFQENLVRVGGEAYFEQVKSDAKAFLDIISKEDNAAALESLAKAIGEIAARVQEMATAPFLESLQTIEPETVESLAESLDRAGMAIAELLDLDTESLDLNAILEILTGLVDTTTTIVNTLNNLRASGEAVGEKFAIVTEVLGVVEDIIMRIINPAAGLTDAWNQFNDVLEQTTGSRVIDYLGMVAEATETEAQATEKAAEAAEEAAEAKEMAAEATDQMTEASNAAADAAAAEAEALEAAKEAALKLADGLEAANEKRDTGLAENAQQNAENVQQIESDHAEAVEEIEQESADKIADINEDSAKKLADIAKEAAKAREDAHEAYADGIEDLEREVSKKREDILSKSKDSLKGLEKETDKAIEDERASFQKDELRETEDHLKDMRRLRMDFMDNLGDAVKSRDARAIVDLRRNYNREKSEREEDFNDKQQREREDRDQRLEEIREAEAEKAAEIMAAQEEELAQLEEYEAEKRAQLEESLAEQLETINEQEAEKLAAEEERRAEAIAKEEEAKAEALAKEQEAYEEAKAKEQERFEEQNAKIEEQYAQQLEKMAEALADAEKINAEGAEKVFNALDKTFGLGGQIDKMMDAFSKRAQQKIKVQVDVEEQFNGPGAGSGSGKGSGKSYPSASQGNNPSNPNAPGFAGGFAKGGRIIADRPTVALFGEGGAEMATFEPLDGGIRPSLQTDSGMMGGDLNISATVAFENLPAGADERMMIEATSKVLVQAFQEARG